MEGHTGSGMNDQKNTSSFLTPSKMLPHIDFMMDSYVQCQSSDASSRADDNSHMTETNRNLLFPEMQPHFLLPGPTTEQAMSDRKAVEHVVQFDTSNIYSTNTVMPDISECVMLPVPENKSGIQLSFTASENNQRKEHKAQEIAVITDNGSVENCEKIPSCDKTSEIKNTIVLQKPAAKRRKQKKPRKCHLSKVKEEGQNNTKDPSSMEMLVSYDQSDNESEGDSSTTDDPEHDANNEEINQHERKKKKKGHLEGLFSKKKHECNLCDTKLTSKVSYHIHMYRTHELLVEGAQEFRCDKCDGIYLSRIHLEQHERNMHGDAMPCPQCGKLLRPAILVDHLKHVHGTPRFMCDICGQTCVSNSRLKGHIAETHDRLRRFPCQVAECGSMFFRNKSLEIHMKNVHEKVRNFTCPWNDCEKSFATGYHLKRHVLLHTGDKPIKCQFCDYSCRQNGSLKLHMKNLHPQYTSTILPCEPENFLSENISDISRTINDNLPEACEHGDVAAHVLEMMKMDISKETKLTSDNSVKQPVDTQSLNVTSLPLVDCSQENQAYPNTYISPYQNYGQPNIIMSGASIPYAACTDVYNPGVNNSQFVLPTDEHASRYLFYPGTVSGYPGYIQQYSAPSLLPEPCTSKNVQINSIAGNIHLESESVPTISLTLQHTNDCVEDGQQSGDDDAHDAEDECLTLEPGQDHIIDPNCKSKSDQKESVAPTLSNPDQTERFLITPKKKYAPPIVLAPLPEKEKKPKKRVPPVLCTDCGLIFDSKLMYLRHMEAEHDHLPPGTKLFKCPTCSKSFFYDAQLQQHVKNTHGERMPCTKCGKMLKPNSLVDHMIQVHEAPRFKCDFCDQRCVTRSILRRHVQDIHDKVKRFSCSVPDCNTLFTRNVTYQNHMRVVHDKIKEYKCTWPDCDKEFGTKYHLNRHLLLHTGRKPISCQHCDYTCRQSVSLKLHLKNTHPNLSV